MRKCVTRPETERTLTDKRDKLPPSGALASQHNWPDVIKEHIIVQL